MTLCTEPRKTELVLTKKKSQRLPSSVWSAALHAKKPVAVATRNPLAVGLKTCRRKKEVKLCVVHLKQLEWHFKPVKADRWTWALT